MNEISKILCVVDPACNNSPALRRAAWLATATGAELSLLAVHYADYSLGSLRHNPTLLNKVRAGSVESLNHELLSVADELQRELNITVRTNAIWDHPLHEGVARFANTSDADLVIKDAHFHAELGVTLLSNQDWQLIRYCPQPLWIVKHASLSSKTSFIAAVDPLHRNDKPAELDDAILRLSRYLVTATRGSLHAFHSFDPRIAASVAETNVYIPVSLPLSDIEEQVREQHTLRFKDVVEPYGVSRECQHIVTGLAEEELPLLAKRLDATAVVMGALARNSAKRVFIGSTAERTLNRLSCDLIIVKPDWFESPVPPNTAEETTEMAG